MKNLILLSLLFLAFLQFSCKYDLPLPERPREIVEPKDSIPETPKDPIPVEPIDSLPATPPESGKKMRVIFDTDANNELDDQHALAYLLFSGNTFTVEGVTVNSTWKGGGIQGQYDEAVRVLELCNLYGKIPLLKGANGKFESIQGNVAKGGYDGEEAIDFIINASKENAAEKLIILAVGKLTNVALALEKDPSIKNRIKVVWLGSNYPLKGEYNMDNDIPSMNFVLNSEVEFEMVTVRYGKDSGTDVVRVTKEEVGNEMPGKGPYIANPVVGRHGDAFHTFGDYSINLFDHIQLDGNPPSRALFDMAAVAIVKDANWATATEMPAPVFENGAWVDRPSNARKIILWEYFNRDAIISDFYDTMENYELVEEIN